MSIGYDISSYLVTNNGYTSTVFRLNWFTSIPNSGSYELIIPDNVVEIAAGVGAGLTGLTKRDN